MSVTSRNHLGTWLSPLPQPSVAAATVAPLAAAQSRSETARVPSDSVHRRYLRTLARMQSSLVKENQHFYCEPPSDAFRAYPLFATADTPNKNGAVLADPQALSRSQKNSPIACPYQIKPNAARARLVRSRSGRALAAAISYGWAEELELAHHTKKLMYVQVRQHTKLENYHDIRRPVFCVNAQSCDLAALDLRLVAVIFTELELLKAASSEFAVHSDFAAGAPCIDQHGRVWIDERVIRRASFHYSQHQISRPADKLYVDEDAIDQRLRRAHMLVIRSHLPEIDINQPTQ